jgi:PIN domain nuclease of toxin-antitoxin system
MGSTLLTAVLLDTQALVWLADDNARLGRRAREAVRQSLRRQGLLASAISFWEIALLLQRGRIVFDKDAAAWRAEALASGIREVAVTGAIGVAAVVLAELPQDPATRIIVASALAENATLVTSDRRLLDWSGRLDRLDAGR